MMFVVLFLFLILSITSADAQPSSSPALRFVVWGDSQFHNPEIFEEFVRRTELLKPDFVLQVGDMINGYTYDPEVARREWARFRRQIEPLTAPYHPVAGNHDVTTPEIAPVFGETWGLDRYYYSFDHGPVHVIVLVTYLGDYHDAFSPEQIEWLKADLEEHASAPHIFVSFHSPLYMNKDFDWEPMHELFKRYPVRAVFTGHSHVYDHRVRDGIRYFCLNTSGNTLYHNHLLGVSNHILQVIVRGTDIDYAILTMDNIYPPEVVPEGQAGKSSRYLLDEQTVLIPDPARGAIDLEVSIPVHNRAAETRDFRLEWETADFDWHFEPRGRVLSLAPDEKAVAAFRVQGPAGHVPRHMLPSLRVTTPYESAGGWKTTLSWQHRMFSPPETRAARCSEAIVLDGVADEAAWNRAPGIKALYLDDRGTTAPESNSVRVLYDSDNLYVAWRGGEPNPEGMSAKAYGDLPLVFGDDDIEMYLDPGRSLNVFYRLMTNSKETVLCSGPDGLFSFKFSVKTHVGEDFWSAEFKIPFAQIKTAPPSPGDVWGFNVRRNRQQAEPPERDWSKMRHFPYQPPYFGVLRFE